MPRKSYTVTESAKPPNDRILKFCIFTNVMSFIVCVMLIIATIVCMKNNRLLVTSETVTSKEISSTNSHFTEDHHQKEETKENHDLFEIDAKMENFSTETHQDFAQISGSGHTTSESADFSQQIFGTYDDFESDKDKIELNLTHSTPTFETSTYSERNQTDDFSEINSTSSNSFFDLPGLVSKIYYDSHKNEDEMNFTSSFKPSTTAATTIDLDSAKFVDAESNGTIHVPDRVDGVDSFSEPERTNEKENLTDSLEEMTTSAFFSDNASTLRRRIFGKAWKIPVTPKFDPSQETMNETTVGVKDESKKNKLNEMGATAVTERSKYSEDLQGNDEISRIGIDN